MPQSATASHASGHATSGPLSALVGRSPTMQAMFRLIERVAPTPLTVLIVGEAGTGKELVARAVHGLSDRARGPFVAVSGGAIPGTLGEAELFGHARGAFAGAVAGRRGLMEEASGGSLFIDEIAALSPSLQVSLLHTLANHRVRPLGSNHSIPVDFRLVVATSRDLSAEVARGEFREDLYDRLNEFPIAVPPLRDRREDIPDLAAHFRRLFARTTGTVPTPFSDAFLDRIQGMAWPGNVRELEHFIQRTIALGLKDPDVRSVQPLRRIPEPLRMLASAPDGPLTIAELESAYIASVLERVHGNRRRAAAILGIDRRTLHRKLDGPA